MSDKIKILIADDEKINHLFYREILPVDKFEIIIAESGIEALEKYNKYSGEIDCILMDMKMPELDGFSTAKQIRKIDTKIPIIAQTAYALHEDIARALNAGCNDYITKPIKEEILLNKIYNLVEHRNTI
ncbi:MAG: response regulator [Bacteroidales bacterium]|jgi:CheY-like chemotaxis protein